MAATSQMLPDPAEHQAAQVCLLTVIRRTDLRSFISLDIKKILNAGTHLVFSRKAFSTGAVGV